MNEKKIKKIIKEKDEALIECLEEIKAAHPDMLNDGDIKNSRGAGWSRVYEKIKNALKLQLDEKDFDRDINKELADAANN